MESKKFEFGNTRKKMAGPSFKGEVLPAGARYYFDWEDDQADPNCYNSRIYIGTGDDGDCLTEEQFNNLLDSLIKMRDGAE